MQSRGKGAPMSYLTEAAAIEGLHCMPDLRLDPTGDNGCRSVAGLTLSVLEVDYIVAGVVLTVSADLLDVWTSG